MQANNAPQEAKDQADLGLYGPAVNSGNLNDKVDRICTVGCQGGAAGIQDYGVEAGGSLWKDRAWLWGSYGRKEIPLTKLGGATDTTYLDDYAGKLNLQPFESNSATIFYFRGDKQKLGRSAGVTRPQETSVDQTGPTTIWKGEDSHVFGPSVVADRVVRLHALRFQPSSPGREPDADDERVPGSHSRLPPVLHRERLQPAAAPAQRELLVLLQHGLARPRDQGRLRLEERADLELTFWPGNSILGASRSYVRAGVCPTGCAAGGHLRARAVTAFEYTYYNGFVGTPSPPATGPSTSASHYDDQYGITTASTVDRNPLFPNLVPGHGFNEGPDEFTWKTWQPRAGVNYALGKDRKTLLRASYARYRRPAGREHRLLGPTRSGGAGSPAPGTCGTTRTTTTPWNRESSAPTIQRLGGFDPLNPNALGSANLIDPNLKAPLTDEFQLSVDREMPSRLLRVG